MTKKHKKIPFLQGKGTTTSQNFSLEGDSLSTGPNSFPAQRSHLAQDWMFLGAHDCHMLDGDGPRQVTCSANTALVEPKGTIRAASSEMVKPCTPELSESDQYPIVPPGDK